MILQSILLHGLLLILSIYTANGFSTRRRITSIGRQYPQPPSTGMEDDLIRHNHHKISSLSATQSSSSLFSTFFDRDDDDANDDVLSSGLLYDAENTTETFYSLTSSAKSFLYKTCDDMDDKTATTIVMISFAVFPSILGFFLWGSISESVADFFDRFAGFQGTNVDGNAFAANLLRPTINGVVVPLTSIALGTLFATTVNVLWERQVKIRTCINREVGELRLLRRAMFGCFGTAQHSKRRATVLQLLHGYAETLMLETKGDSIGRLEDIQRNGGISINEIDEIADMLHGVDGAAASRQGSVGTAEDLLVSLNGHRSERVATTLSYFPDIHWVLLIFLYMSIQIAFFIDSNQGVLQYLNSLQLRVLFSIIIGVGSGAGMLLKELQDPFSGSVGVNLETMQLRSFEELLEADIADAENEMKKVGLPGQLIFSSFPEILDENDPGNNKRTRRRHRPKYNTGNTLLFHLFTGPKAGTARIIGEVLAWTFRQVFNLWTSILKLRLLWTWGNDQWKSIRRSAAASMKS